MARAHGFRPLQQCRHLGRNSLLKGIAGSPAEDPYQVDGLSGGITANGVTHLVHFWMGQNGFGPYIRTCRPSRLNPKVFEGESRYE